MQQDISHVSSGKGSAPKTTGKAKIQLYILFKCSGTTPKIVVISSTLIRFPCHLETS